jgi:16S rRNA processing protein RimM
LTSKAGDARAVIGRVAGTFGLRGEVKVATSDPSDFRPGLSVRASRNDRDLVIAAIRPHKERLLVLFEGVDDVTAAETLYGAELSACLGDLPELPPNTYRDEDLIGMRVTDARLGDLGPVSAIAHYPHADMLVVGDRSLLIPMLAAYGVAIDVASATISTSLPLGFEDL